MNKLSIFLIGAFFFSFSAVGQKNEIELYRKAYSYLERTVEIDVKTFRQNCELSIVNKKIKIQPKLQVASKFITNDRGFPLCDLLQKKYKVTESCVYAIGSGKFEITKQVQDSLQTFWKNYDSKKLQQMDKILDPMISSEKIGYQVFFSDIYENTIAAEVKSFCSPYDKFPWYGSSISYYFVFDDNDEIIEIYSGISIHYN